MTLDGTLVSEETWTWDEAAFREWWERRRAWYQAYWARQRWARIAPAMARMHALRAGLLDALQSSGAFDPSSFERMTDCGPFACGASSTYVPPVTPASRGASSSSAVARRTGARWMLSNAHASLVIHADQSCRVDYSLTSHAPSTMVFDTPRSDDGPVASCAVRERTFAGGAALELSWVSDRWTQQVIVALADDASLAEATIARSTVDANDVRTIELSNLSPSPRQWNIGGRDLSLDPGSMLRVRTGGEPDESPPT